MNLYCKDLTGKLRKITTRWNQDEALRSIEDQGALTKKIITEVDIVPVTVVLTVV